MKDKAAVWVGLAAIVGMGVLVTVLFPRAADATEKEWSRLVYLLGGVEAIAFAAAGYFFGREVNRARAERAEEDVRVSRDDSRRAEDRASRAEKHGQSLADLVRLSTEPIVRDEGQARTLESAEGPQLMGGLLGDVRAVADRYFPAE
jgi:hypothetical protein